jgi:hypothetical protein
VSSKLVLEQPRIPPQAQDEFQEFIPDMNQMPQGEEEQENGTPEDGEPEGEEAQEEAPQEEAPQEDAPAEAPPPNPPPSPQRRSTRNRVPPKTHPLMDGSVGWRAKEGSTDIVAKTDCLIHFARAARVEEAIHDAKTPRGYYQASTGPDKVNWIPAMTREIGAHTKNETWELISPDEVKGGSGDEIYFIESVWKYRIKTQNGVITSFKARLCANGMFMQCDHLDTYSPVARATTVRLMFALAAAYGATLHTGDVPSAYVKSRIDPKMTIYMKQPKGFVVKGKEDWLCRLNKALYGIPPAGKLWNDMVRDFLMEIGFEQTVADPCLFVMTKGDEKMFISLTVDDFLEFSTCETMRGDVVAKLVEKFDYKDGGDATWFLGMAITQEYREIAVDQGDYVRTILESHKDLRPQSTPAIPGNVLKPKEEGDKECPFGYRALCGKLRYLTITRPDIEYALNQCCRFQNEPSEDHGLALLRIVGYLKRYPGKALTYEKSVRNGERKDVEVTLSGVGDASFADIRPDRRSTYGFFVLLNGRPISWRS